jgi:hypothetical protein
MDTDIEEEADRDRSKEIVNDDTSGNKRLIET